MIWFFERETERLQCEIRRAADTDAIELVVTGPNGPVSQQFDDPRQVLERSQVVWHNLFERGWRPLQPRP